MPVLQQDVRAVQREFDAILVHQRMANLSAEKKNFLDEVAKLKGFVIKKLVDEDKAFDPETCLALAQRTKTLGIKLLSNKATNSDVDAFDSENAKFKSMSTTAKVLTTILATLAGIAAGIVAGFFIAGPLGSLIGGAAGGVAAASATAFSVFRKNAVDKVCDSAEKIAAKNPDYCDPQYPNGYPDKSAPNYDNSGSNADYDYTNSSGYEPYAPSYGA